jgi:hypothetical protein
MPMVPTGFAHQSQLDNEIAKALRKLGKETVRVNYSLGTDSTGEPSIFFRIVLTDAASNEDKLAEVTGRIATLIFDEIRPHENWGYSHTLVSAANPSWRNGTIRSGPDRGIPRRSSRTSPQPRPQGTQKSKSGELAASCINRLVGGAGKP